MLFASILSGGFWGYLFWFNVVFACCWFGVLLFDLIALVGVFVGCEFGFGFWSVLRLFVGLGFDLVVYFMLFRV